MLTSIELAESFPEMLPRAKRRVTELRKLIKEAWDPFMEAVWKSELDPNDNWSFRGRAMWVEACKTYIRHDPRTKELNLLEHYIRIVSGKASKEKRDLTQIKAIPIQTMADLGRTIRSGQTIKACCPFHSERTPSFYIYTKDNRFHCFGCGADGDAIEFYMRIHKVSFTQAIATLGGNHGN